MEEPAGPTQPCHSYPLVSQCTRNGLRHATSFPAAFPGARHALPARCLPLRVSLETFAAPWEGAPEHWESLPHIRTGLPHIGRVFPMIGKSLPSLGMSFPMFGTSVPKLGTGLPSAEMGLRSTGRSLPALGLLATSWRTGV